ncbi:hypothetical protein GCM10009557_23000 [Virgisporangium ochraceum]|uniref:Uncharacterized protein n=1 Tax=Virgisporangium ochraceum TaxID=65505 RepID=A0A8J4EK87_9ACTN|nr:hypothetical protein [Virgisporangium ochraceum]GIJ75132.1 hypothetical protein Voc01_100490 [Virgisporangium ochraceum]
MVLYWLPLGAGGRSVRVNGRVFEACAARLERRAVRDLYHSALEVRLDGDRVVIEMTPVWGNGAVDRGVVREGPVGLRRLGRFTAFRYEVRRWHSGVIPDVGAAVGGPRQIGDDACRVRRLLDLVPQVPALTWGRDEMHTGEMWNSNSLTAWLLARSGHEVGTVRPPEHGRAPGWHAGLMVAAMQVVSRSRTDPNSDSSADKRRP